MYMYRCILLKMLGQGVMEPVKVWEAVGGLTIKAFASLLVCKAHDKLCSYYMYIMKHYKPWCAALSVVSTSVFSPNKFQRMRREHDLGGVCSHIKTFGFSPFSHQKKV